MVSIFRTVAGVFTPSCSGICAASGRAEQRIGRDAAHLSGQLKEWEAGFERNQTAWSEEAKSLAQKSLNAALRAARENSVRLLEDSSRENAALITPEKDLNSTKSRLASSLLSQDRLGDAADRRNVIERVAFAETLWILREFNERGRCLLDLGITLQDAPLRATNRPGHAESLTLRSAVRRRRPEARPSFASRVKTPYNRSFGGKGNKARLSISFPAESEAARLSSLG